MAGIVLERAKAPRAAAGIGAFAMLALASPAWASDNAPGAAKTHLERLRDDPQAANDRGEIDALVREAKATDDAATRIAAEMLAAEAYVGRLRTPAPGEALFRAVAEDPASDPLTAAQATNVLVRAELDDGDVAGARADANHLTAHVGPELRRLVAARSRRWIAVRCAVLVLLVTVVVSALTLRRSRGRREAGPIARSVRAIAPLALGFGAIVAIFGGGAASTFAPGSAMPFVALGVIIVPIVLVARAFGAARSSRRVAPAALFAAAVVAAAILVLDVVEASSLASFGL